MSEPHKLITVEGAAELLSVSKRTIATWISDGTLPMPTSIGRRVYWHPEAFRAWQDSLFGIQEPPTPTPSRRGRPRSQLH